MFVRPNHTALCIAAIAAFYAASFTATTRPALAQTAAPSVNLTPYTAPDKSASAGVPSGWKANGSQTVITLTGPQGETIALGRTFVARNAAFEVGQKGAGGTDLSMPFNAPLTQKLIMVYQQGAALSGQPAPQITFTSAAPMQVPAILGQCGRFVANLTGPAQPQKIMGIFCSFPLDTGGAFKNVILVAQAPASLAAQDAPIAQAVFSSYQIPQAMLAKKLAPFTAPPPVIATGGNPGTSPVTIPGSGDVSAICFDEGVIRGYGPRQLPKECGGLAPNP
ncbi:MAG: hypothetical protein WCC27_13125 [Acidobacteriaceae bacterium]